VARGSTAPRLSVVIVTRNEASRVRRCLESVVWADELVVVDADSTDATAAICREFTVNVHRRTFDTFDRQKNFALDRATGLWLLSVDADEVVSLALREELEAVVAADGGGYEGFVLARRNHLCGHPIVHTWGRDALVRLVRRGRGRFVGDVHAKLVVDGPVGEIMAPLFHFNSDSLDQFIAKNLLYTRLEAEARVARGERPSLARALLAPLRVFLFRYVRLRGYRDGWMGFVLCVLLAFFTFLLHARIRELSR